MHGYLALVLHAHLPFVRHPEHDRFLEENWLFEAITESYIPLLQVLQAWQGEAIKARLTFSLTPSVSAMLRDPFLQSRYCRYLDQLIDLAEKETQRTLWEKSTHDLAGFYLVRFRHARDFYQRCGGDLVGQFRNLQDDGLVEIAMGPATHALLPLLTAHPPSLRAQVLVGRDEYRTCFGCEPRGIWLPECAYTEELEEVLCEARVRWFILDTHGMLQARPQPRHGVFAPLFTPDGLAAFGRDPESAKQVWSRTEGYPGDPRYRDFYRDIGFDVDLDYLAPYLAAPGQRSFTGIKYHRITGPGPGKAFYDRAAACQAAEEHAAHFSSMRVREIQRLAPTLDRPPLLLSPYDAELFGHWWYEGPEFLDLVVRKACLDQKCFTLVSPEDYLRRHNTNQVATPAASSWGEGGYWRMWLNAKNEWIYPHLQAAQERMSELARSFGPDAVAPPASSPQKSAAAVSRRDLPRPLLDRALKQAARELLLAQASDWPFILRTGTSPDYARNRVKLHLLRFTQLYDQTMTATLDENSLATVESADNLFPDLDYRYWI